MSSSNTAQCFPDYVNARLRRVTAAATKHGVVMSGTAHVSARAAH